MTVSATVAEINNTLKDVFDFIQNSESVKPDFEEYLKTSGAVNIPLNQAEKVLLPYIFERRINEKSILEMYKDEKGASKTAESFSNSVFSVFEIKKVLKDGFELYNLTNEKTYKVLPLTKMINFRGVYAGQFITARIIRLGEEYYIMEISGILSASQKDEAYRYAVMKLVQTPDLLYYDNPEKEEEIKSAVSEMYAKFIKTFGTDIILTTNRHADDIIGSFNEGEDIDLSDKGCNITKYRYFRIKELDNDYTNFLESSMGGFSSHDETYDTAVIFDKEKGLYAVPFYETFCKIFENKESVENAKGCAEYFLTNGSIPDIVLKRVSSEYPNFTETINEMLHTDYTFDELLQKYKSAYLKKKIYSSATVLFCSEVFSKTLEFMLEKKPPKREFDSKIGRNAPCPCGSGKKYKNCCGV